MKKKTFYAELAFFLGILALAVGSNLMERANFGMSVVLAPSYVIFVKLHELWPWLTFGMMQYIFQAALLLLMCLAVQRFRITYLLAFASSVLFGLCFDGCKLLLDLITVSTPLLRHFEYVLGMVVCSLGVSLLFHTYITPEVYELVVIELADRCRWNENKVKTVYDCTSAALGVGLSFLFFGLWHFEGVKIGTVLCALINGLLIAGCTKLLEHFFSFKDGLPLRTFFKTGKFPK